MKLNYEDKVQIYELRKQGQSFKQLSKRFGVDVSGLKVHDEINWPLWHRYRQERDESSLFSRTKTTNELKSN